MMSSWSSFGDRRSSRLVSEYEYQLSSGEIEEKYGLAALRKRAGH